MVRSLVGGNVMQVRTNETNSHLLFDWDTDTDTIVIIRNKVKYHVKLFDDYEGKRYKIIATYPKKRIS